MPQTNTGGSRFQRMGRNAAILLGVFLLGLLPPLVRTMQLKSELATAQLQIEMAETRELASLSFLEVSQNNFGVATQHATQLFDRLTALSLSAKEPVRSIVNEALQKRDSVMGMLAKADPRARTELQYMVGRLMSTGEVASRTRSK